MKNKKFFLILPWIILLGCSPTNQSSSVVAVKKPDDITQVKEPKKEEATAPVQLQVGSDCSKSNSEVERKECLAKDYAQADQELNRVYKEAKSKVNESEGKSLTDAQLSWITYRDKKCELETHANLGGTGYRAFLNICLARVTRERITELQSYLTNTNTSSSTIPEVKKSKEKVFTKSDIQRLSSKVHLSAVQVESFLKSEQENNENSGRTILPTYLPDGYRIESASLNICNVPLETKKFHTYRIVYRKSENISFRVSNVFVCYGGAAPIDAKNIDIPSKKFSKVRVSYKEFDSLVNGPLVTGELATLDSETSKESSTLIFFNYTNPKLNIEEAKKIMSSMEYLNEKK